MLESNCTKAKITQGYCCVEEISTIALYAFIKGSVCHFGTHHASKYIGIICELETQN